MIKAFGIFAAAIFAIVLAFDASAASQQPPAGYTASQLLFNEQFTSPSLDTSKWNPWMGDDQYGRWSNKGQLPSPYSALNCGNAQCSDAFSIPYYDPYPYGHNVKIDTPHLVGGNGNLAIIARPSDKYSGQGYKWATAAISSYGKMYVPAAGGYVQIHAKMPDMRYGAWPSLWLLSKGGPEIDMQEGGYTKGTNVNRNIAINFHGSGSSQQVIDTGVDLTADYHNYGLEYNPGKWLKFYLDGKLLGTYTQSIPTNAPYQIIIDMEFANQYTNGWHTVADIANHPGPFQLDVDNVQIYSLSTGGTTPPPTSDTTPPSVPTGLKTTSVSGTEIALAWNASTDASSPITYDVYRDGTYLNFSTATSYKDSTVTAGKDYKYQVLAYDPARNLSALSTAITVTAGTGTVPPTSDTTAPSVPTNLAATLVAPVQVDLLWTASTDNIAVTGYNIFRTGIKIGTTDKTAYVDATVVGSSNYSYVVQAFDAAGNVANSPALIVSTPTFADGASVATKVSGTTAVLSKAGRGTTVCTQPTGINGTILSGPQKVKGETWWYVSFLAGCSGWVPQSDLVLN